MQGTDYPKPPPPTPPRFYKGHRLVRQETTENLTSGQTNLSQMESMSVIAFFAFMFCALCLGVALGGFICAS